jgi:hypothetical protein
MPFRSGNGSIIAVSVLKMSHRSAGIDTVGYLPAAGFTFCIFLTNLISRSPAFNKVNNQKKDARQSGASSFSAFARFCWETHDNNWERQAAVQSRRSVDLGNNRDRHYFFASSFASFSISAIKARA